MLEHRAINMVNRTCRDCPIPSCGARYLVKLSNHLSDVHLMSSEERRPWLQEAKLQPRVKVMVYLEHRLKHTSDASRSRTWEDIFYQPSVPRKVQRRKINKQRRKGV